MRALNTMRKNNRLYVRLLASDAGAVVRGEPLSSLLPSVLGVLEADRSTGDFIPLRNATLGEWNLPTEHAVVGSRVLINQHRVDIECVHFCEAFFVFALVRLRPSRCPPPSRSSGKRRRLTTSCEERSRICRSTGMEGSFSDQPRSSSPRRASPFLWAMAVAPDGAIYVGSGNEGKVFKIDGAGKIGDLLDTTELEVHALALASDGSLYAATSPEGRIYKVDRSGKGVPFFDPEDKYIWSLALDRKGNVYTGTGEKGLIYQITQDGKGSPFYSTKATHVITLTFERTGSCWPAPRARATVPRRSIG